MGLLGFLREEETALAETQRVAALIGQVYDWVCEDLDNRVLLVCMAAVIGSHVGLIQPDIERTETYWLSMMAEHGPTSDMSPESRPPPQDSSGSGGTNHDQNV